MDDSSCRDHEVCVLGACSPLDAFECTGDQHAIVDVNPAEVNFGAGGTATLTIRNLGSCLLTVQNVFLTASTPADFSCAGGLCEASAYPKLLPPNRAIGVELSFTPAAAGVRSGELRINSDDANQPSLAVTLVGNSGSGQSRLLLEPEVLDLGFVPPGQEAARTVRLSNIGNGNAVIRLSNVSLAAGATQFSSTPEISAPTNVITLRPGVRDAPDCLNTGACLDIAVRFQPTATSEQTNELLVTYETTPGAPSTARVFLRASSATPPVLAPTPATLDFGNQALGGMVAAQLVQIENTGPSLLTVHSVVLLNGSSDFLVDPLSLLQRRINPGAATQLRVTYDPTQEGSVMAQLRVSSNDPVVYDAALGAGVRSITVVGNGTGTAPGDLLKLEMTFGSATGDPVQRDLQDVDLMLESPLGDLCTKPTYSVDSTGGITGILEDSCASWTTGAPSWVKLGGTRQMERIILRGPGLLAGDYTAKVSYQQDCTFMLLQPIAALTGRSIEELLAALDSGVVDLDSADIASFIANNCWTHAPTTAVVTAFINGTAAITCNRDLESPGLVRDVLRVTRSAAGGFSAACVP